MTDYDLEGNIIGGLLLFPEDYSSYTLSALSPEDFENRPLGDIYFLTAQALKEDPAADTVKLIAGISDPSLRVLATESCQCFVARGSYRELVRMVADRGKNRRVKTQAARIAMSDQEDILPELRKLVEEAERDESIAAYSEILAQKAIEYLNTINKPFDPKERIWTGFARVDENTGGLRKRTISYVGAPPSTGKTAFALNVLKNQLGKKGKSLFFTLEMSTQQIFERLLADLTETSYTLINKNCLNQRQRQAMYDRLQDVVNSGELLVIDDVYTVEGMEQAVSEVSPQFVVVDFMQCVKTLQRFQIRRQEIDHISGEFKRMAKRYDCHIMVLSQVSRNGKDAPRMSDLKESGALEQDGDYIFMLHRPYVLEKSRKVSPKDAQLLLDKNKFGNTGIIDMNFIGEFQRFKEVHYEP